MTILLVRHATAGKRKRWQSDDRLRPLDDRGREQAAELPAVLQQYEPVHIYSSPHLRCRQTVEPLAEELGLSIQETSALAEGTDASDTLALARELGERDAVFCTHGDVVEALLGEESEKGSTWVLELVDGDIIRRAYLPPAA